MRIGLLMILISVFSLSAKGQDFSNKGKEFWLGYGNHVRMFDPKLVVPSTNCYLNGNQQICPETMEVYITSDVNTTGYVEIKSIGFKEPFNVLANQISKITIPRSAALSDTGKFDHGIHVLAEKPIVVYGFIYVSAISGATVCLPVSVLGRDYYSINYSQVSNEENSYSYFFVVATEDNTRVRITTTGLTRNGKPANVPFEIDLNKGQIYQVLGSIETQRIQEIGSNGNLQFVNRYIGTDLTGSKIESIATPTNPCKKIAVFCGSGKISIGCNSPQYGYHKAGSSDNLYQQMYPSNAWGKKYISIPTFNTTLINPTLNTNIFRIFRTKSTTVVKINGTSINNNLFVNNYYDYQSNNPVVIESESDPIMVAQYLTTSTSNNSNNVTNNSDCGNGGLGDPDMIFLNPVEQIIQDVTMNSMQPDANTNLSRHYVNVVIKNEGTAVSSFTIDGINYSSRFKTLSQDNKYSFATIFLNSKGGHRLKSDSGFNAIAYGFGGNESYAYSAGTNLKDLTQFVSVKNTFSTVKFPATCKGSPFNLSITLPFRPLKINWDFKGNTDLGSNPPSLSNSDNSPLLADDSLPNPNDPSKKLYTYFIKKSDGNPKEYKASQKGIIPIEITVINPSPDGCTGEQNISFEINIYDPPTTEIKYTSTGCFANSVLFEPQNIQSDSRQIIKYIWSTEPGLSDTSANANVTKLYTSEGSKPVTLKVITDIGCISEEASINVPLTATPSPEFDFAPIRCLDKPFLLTDKSKAIGNSNLENWTWEYTNVPGATNDVYDKNSSSRNPLKTFSQASVNVRLTVKNNTGCSKSIDKTIAVNPSPIVDFGILQTICMPLGIGNFSSSASTISDNSQSQFKYDWNFGDAQSTTANPNTSADPSPTHKYSASGNINVSLKITSNNGCESSQTKVFNVNPQPIAKIDFKREICDRESFTFKDISVDGFGNPLNSRTWKFNSTASYTSQTFTSPVLPPGDYPVVFSGVSVNGCASTEINETVTIHPLPTPDFSLDGPACEKESVSFVQNAVANVGSINRWIWRIGNSNTLDNITDPNFKLSKTFTSWGDQIVRLLVENSKGCKSDTLVRNVRINPKPLPAFDLPDVCQGDRFATFESKTAIADISQTLSHIWDFGDERATSTNPNVGTGAITTHRYSLAGDYVVKLTSTSSAGCISFLSQSFRVNGAVPKADFLVLSQDALCSNTAVKLKNLSSVDFGDVTKLEIFWDYTNSPNVFVKDDNPTPDKIYSNLYTDFLNQPNKNFTILVKAYSGGTCVDEEVKTIIVNGSPKVSLQPLQGICLEAQPRKLNEATYVDVAGIPAGSERFIGNGVSQTGIFDPAAAGAGTHLINYRFTSSKGCYDEKSGNIVVWPRPVADFAVSNITCEKNTITFTNGSVAKAGTITDWNWNFGNGGGVINIKNGNPQNIVYNNYNIYNVSLDVLTSNGCTSIPKIIPVTVNPLPLVNFDLPKVCLPIGKAIFLNNSDIPDGKKDLMSYKWTYGDPDDPGTTVVKDGLHYYKKLGVYSVKLIVTSIDGCIDSLARQLTDVFPQPKAGFKSLDSACLGKDIQFTDSSKGVVRPITEWNWDFGNGVTNSIPNPLYQFKATGTYPVSLWVKTIEGCISDTASKKISIFPYPKITAGPDISVLDDGESQIMASATGSALVYNWTPGTYLSDPKILQPIVIKPQEDIIYKLSVTGRGACTSTDEVKITSLKLPRAPNTFTPNGDGVNDLWEIKYLEQYPGSILEVYTTRGQLVYRSVGYAGKWDGTQNGRALPFGTYYYVIDPKSGRAKISGYVTILK